MLFHKGQSNGVEGLGFDRNGELNIFLNQIAELGSRPTVTKTSQIFVGGSNTLTNGRGVTETPLQGLLVHHALNKTASLDRGRESYGTNLQPAQRCPVREFLGGIGLRRCAEL